MSVRAVEMVRRIRNRHYEETKRLTVAELMEYYKAESEKFREEVERQHKRGRMRGKAIALESSKSPL